MDSAPAYIYHHCGLPPHSASCSSVSADFIWFHLHLELHMQLHTHAMHKHWLYAKHFVQDGHLPPKRIATGQTGRHRKWPHKSNKQTQVTRAATTQAASTMHSSHTILSFLLSGLKGYYVITYIYVSKKSIYMTIFIQCKLLHIHLLLQLASTLRYM